MKIPKQIKFDTSEGISHGTLTYAQMDGSEDMTITATDEGGGPFIQIKTEKFSIDNINQLLDIVNDALTKFGIELEKRETHGKDPCDSCGMKNHLNCSPSTCIPSGYCDFLEKPGIGWQI